MHIICVKGGCFFERKDQSGGSGSSADGTYHSVLADVCKTEGNNRGGKSDFRNSGRNCRGDNTGSRARWKRSGEDRRKWSRRKRDQSEYCFENPKYPIKKGDLGIHDEDD